MEGWERKNQECLVFPVAHYSCRAKILLFKSKCRTRVSSKQMQHQSLRSAGELHFTNVKTDGIKSVVFFCCSVTEQWVIKIVYPLKGLLSHGCQDFWSLLSCSVYQQPCSQDNDEDSFHGAQNRSSLILWCNLVVYFNSTNFSKKLQNTQMERTQDSQFFLLFLLFVYIVSSHGDYSYIQ